LSQIGRGRLNSIYRLSDYLHLSIKKIHISKQNINPIF
jgi:hypothetical protein